jgi:type I restriction enzyme S subunit
MTSSFLFYLLLTKHFTEYAISGSQRAGMPKVNQNHLFAYAFHLPPIAKQAEIVKTLDQVLNITESSKREYNKKLQSLIELKQSLLKTALTGNLTKH